MHSKRRNDDIPIKIGGWDGRFVYEKPKVKEGYELVKSTRGTLDRQTWQDGQKVVINKGKQTQNASETTERRTSTTSTTSQSSKEHIVRVERNDYDANTVSRNENVCQSSSQDQQRQREFQQHQQQQQQYNRANETTKNSSQGLHAGRDSTPQPTNRNGYAPAQSDQNASNASNLHGYSNETEVLPAQWDGKFPEGYLAGRPRPQQNASNAVDLHGYSNETEVLPAQWDGKFPEGYLAGRPRPQQNASNASNLYGYTTEPEILPARWDGKFPEGYLAGRPKPNQNASNSSNLYGFSTEPTILPTVWDGKFTKSGETYTIPDRNRSNADNLYEFDTKPEILPTTWNGQFQLDPNVVRIKPERNVSDVRDYADHRRFVTRE